MAYLPKPSHLRLVYARLTASPLTTLFTVISLTHFVLQLSFQAWAFSINANASSLLSNILTTGGLNPLDNFAVLVPLSKSSNGTTTGGELRICNQEEMQHHDNIYECPIVWRGRADAVSGIGYSTPVSASSSPTDTATPDAEVIGFVSSAISTTATSTASRVNAQLPSTATPTQVHVISPSVSDDDSDEDFAAGSSAAGGALSQAAEHIARELVKRDHDLVKVVPMTFWRRNIPIDSVGSENIDGVTAVTLPTFKNLTSGTIGVTLSDQCVQMIIWPNQIIHNTKREDATFLAFQVWVLGMSIVALLNESIPHTLAALLTHLLATAWSVYQIFNTKNFQNEFIRSTIDSGRCGGVNLLPGYWSQRHGAEIAVLVVNCVSLVAGAVLSWRLVKMFGWQTFKRIGASLEINRVYKIILIFSIGLQLGFFFVVAAMGLWLDSLFNTVLGSNAEHASIYQTLAILACIFMAPWLYLGWRSVRHENDKFISAFIALSLLMLAGWGSLFFSATLRWEFTEWKFFATMIVASIVFLVMTTVLGVVCWYNFDKGLKKFLTNTEDPIFEREKDQFTRVYSRELDIEKSDPDVVNFPGAVPIPTYAVAFGAGNKAPRPHSQASSSVHSDEIGSPLHDPSFSDAEHGYSKPTSEYSQSSTLPPRFRPNPADSPASSIASLTIHNNYLATIHQNADIGRSDSATSSDAGSNPFSLDVDRRSSMSSGFSGKSKGPGQYKTYVSPGSHHVATITTMHTKQESQASWEGRKNWVIE